MRREQAAVIFAEGENIPNDRVREVLRELKISRFARDKFHHTTSVDITPQVVVSFMSRIHKLFI